jgi:uncharacterized protein
MDSPAVRAAIVAVLGGGVLLTSLAALYTTRKDVPGRIVLAAGNTHYFELAQSYKPSLERNGVTLDIKRRLDIGQKADAKQKKAIETFGPLYALIDPKSDVNAAIVKGGLYGSLKGRLATDKAKDRHKQFAHLRSLGRVMLEPIWVFTRKEDTNLKGLRDLKDKTILTGTRESGARRISNQLLKANAIEGKNSKRIDQDLAPDARQLLSREADAAILILPADSKTILDLLRVKEIRLMDFEEEAAGYVDRFPALTRVKLHKGAVEFDGPIPDQDLTLVATSAALLVRPDMDPALVSLLTHAVINNPKSGFDRLDDPVLFYKAGEFPNISDPEFVVSDQARLIYKSGELPYMLRTLAPIGARASVPFSVTAYVNSHWTKLVLLIPVLAILLPLMRIVPIVYNWNVRRRLVSWYRQLKNLEGRIDSGAADHDMPALLDEMARIESNVRMIRVPSYYSDQLYELRLHVDFVRQRLATRPQQRRMAAE